MFAARHNVALAAVVAFLLLGASAAKAAPITYDFTVTGTSGPLNGTAAHGTFSYDSSSIVPRGANQATGLLTSLTRISQTRAGRGGEPGRHSGNSVVRSIGLGGYLTKFASRASGDFWPPAMRVHRGARQHCDEQAWCFRCVVWLKRS